MLRNIVVVVADLKNNHLRNVVQFIVNPFRRCGVVGHNKIKSAHPKKNVHSYIMAHKFIGIRISLSNQAKCLFVNKNS